MILFFYGEDTFRMRQKLKALKEKFVTASLGDTNLSVLDGGKVTFDEFVRQILAMPFLSKSRLVIVENIMAGKKSAQGESASGREVLEKIPDSLAKVPNSTVLVFVEEEAPDRRTALFKRLNKPGQAQEFKLLEPEALRRWIKKEVEDRGGTIDPAAISKLFEYVGSDLWRMSNEIDKLTTYNKQLTTENIELLVNPQVESNIFKMIEAVAKKDLKIATQELYKLLKSGEHELYILTMIVWQYRNLLIIKDLSERIKTTNSWSLAKKAGLSPFVVQKSLMVLPRYSLEDLRKIYRTLSDFDIKIKTGKIESRVALELMIFELAKDGDNDHWPSHQSSFTRNGIL